MKPKHYQTTPEPIELIEASGFGYGFNRGNVIKYVSRAAEKGEELSDLKKALWYLQREIARVEKGDARD
jgi:hypothetical protein